LLAVGKIGDRIAADALGSVWWANVNPVKDAEWHQRFIGRWSATVWNQDDVKQVQKIVHTLFSDGRDNCRESQNFSW